MLSKFTANLLKTTVAVRQRTPARSSIANFASKPCGQQPEKPKKDYVMELASKCDNDKIIFFMQKYFLKEEPLYKALIPGQKPKEILDIFRECLDHGLTLVARNTCSKEIIGVLINEKSYKLDGVKLGKMSKDIKEPNLKKMFETWAIINSEPQLFKKLGVDEVYHLAAMAIEEKQVGKGIGFSLIKRSLELAREKEFQFVKMNATSDHTRKIAEKLGMNLHWSKSYKDILCRGTLPRALPEPPHTHLKVYYMDLNCPC